MNFDLKIGKGVQLLMLGVVCLFGYALIRNTYETVAEPKPTPAVRAAQGIQADLCASFKDLGIRDENCP